jgi:lipopolysaccharide transport system ATP-binding protein
MYVRLAFAVAAHLDPEIMIIDEVLAVGDGEFQSKCLGKMQDVADSGRTVIFVSHNLGAVRQLCSNVVLVENGTKTFEGPVSEGIARYQQFFASTNYVESVRFHGPLSGAIQIESIELSQNGATVRIIDPLKPVEIVVHAVSTGTFDALELNLSFFRDGTLLSHCFDSPSSAPLRVGDFKSYFTIPSNVLRPGKYSCGFGAQAGHSLWCWAEDVAILEVEENYGTVPARRCSGVVVLPYSGKRLQNVLQG